VKRLLAILVFRDLIENIGDPLAYLASKKGVYDHNGEQNTDQRGREQGVLMIGDGKGRVNYRLKIVNYSLEENSCQPGDKANHNAGQD